MLLVVVFAVVVLLWWFFAARRRRAVPVARGPLGSAPDRSGAEARLRAFQDLTADLARHGMRGDTGIAELIALAKQQAAAALDAPATAQPAVAAEPAVPPPITMAVAAPTVVVAGRSPGDRSHAAQGRRRPPQFAPLEALPALAPLRPRAALRPLEPSAALAARKPLPSHQPGG